MDTEFRGDDAVPAAALQRRLALALGDSHHSKAATHRLYNYPASLSPKLAEELIAQFSRPGSLIADPFCGGGTTIVEALRAGRRAVGGDLNSIASLVSTVKTQPLSDRDVLELSRWTSTATRRIPLTGELPPAVPNAPRNLPRATAFYFWQALETLVKSELRPRAKMFGRCVLLRLGQFVLESQQLRRPLTRKHMAACHGRLFAPMVHGVADFVQDCANAGLAKRAITSAREVVRTTACSLPERAATWEAPDLILTSPPYPGVHVLYHRWQCNNRRETPAPYWIVGSNELHGEAHYTGGSRTPYGLEQYFRMILETFSTLRRSISARTTVAQVVGFSDPEVQFPRYLRVMREAGYELTSERVASRQVPNRRWYAKRRSPAVEHLLVHRRR